MRHQPIIFCPQCANLILQKTQCDQPGCGWNRPALGGDPGSKLWEKQLPGVPGVPYSQPATYNDLLFIAVETRGKYGVKQGSIIALSAASSEVVWTKPIPNERVARLLLIAEDHLLITTEDTRTMGANDNALLALNPVTGEAHWQYPVPAHSISAPAVANDLVFFTTNNRTGYGLDLNKGTLRWQVNDLPSWTPSPPAVGPDAFYIGSRANLVIAITKAGTTYPIWQDEQESNWFPNAPAYQSGTLYVTGWDKKLYALDVKKREKCWSVPIGRGPTSPPVVGEYVYVGAKEETKHTYSIQAINPTDGAVVWRFTAGRYFTAPPLLHQNLLFAPCEDGHLYVLDAKTGQSQWQFPVGDERVEKLCGVPIINESKVTFVDQNGMVYVLSWQQPNAAEDWSDVTNLRQQGDWETAGSVSAWHGDYEGAAADFEQGKQFYQAGQLYTQAKEWDKAGDCYIELDVEAFPQAITRAIAAYQTSGNKLGEANALLRAGEFEKAGHIFEHDLGMLAEAAAAYEKAGLLIQAANCYDLAGQWDKTIQLYLALKKPEPAAQLYEQMGEINQAVNILQKFGLIEKTAELMIRHNRQLEAADLLSQSGYIVEAVDIYQAIGQVDQAIAILLEAKQVSTASEILVKNGRLSEAANLLEENGYLKQSADLWFDANDPANAAAVYERAEKWSQSATIWEANQDLNRAAEQYIKANQLEKAIKLYRKLKDYKQALALAESIKDTATIAQLADQMQDWGKAATAYLGMAQPREAARRFEQAGKWEKAALLYAGEGMIDKAVECWQQIDQLDKAVYLLTEGSRYHDAAQLLEKDKQFIPAAELLLASPQPDKKEAARLFHLAGKHDSAIDLFTDTGDWTRVRDMAVEMNSPEREAYACLELATKAEGFQKEEYYLASAQAFVRAAEKYDDNKEKTVDEIVLLWEQAAKYFQEALEPPEKIEHCEHQICRLRQWPILTVTIETGIDLIEGEYHTLTLHITNEGYGSAHYVSLWVRSNSFDGDAQITQRLSGLRPQQTRPFLLRVRPKKEELGSAVPLDLELSYLLQTKEEVKQKIRKHVSVKRETSQYISNASYPTPTSSTQPMVIDIGSVEFNTEANQNESSVRLHELANLLHKYFNMNELNELCLSLDIEPESITINPGANRQSFCISLVRYCFRVNLVEKLIEVCMEKRPHVNWKII